MKTDSQVQSDVIQQLKWDPSLNHERIGVSVSGGIVTLSGSVPSYFEKSAAESVTQRVSGVAGVVEKIEVKLPGAYKRGDQEIAQEIVNQFKWNIQIPNETVKVRVENGWVTLSGEVEWDFQRVAAQNSATKLVGVIGVSNNIRIQAKKVQPDVVKKKIEEALKREAEREARRIGVEVNGSTVTLTGEVYSFTEMNEAKWAAWSAPGVTTIQNNMQIKI